LVLLADTHIRDGSGRRLPDPVWAAIDQADGVLHAGDVVGPEFLDALEQRARTWTVLGNNDYALAGRLPETIEVELEGVRIAMIHDSGQRKGREPRMAARFPSADLVVFGHSHDPYDELSGGQRLFNPGSAIERRRQPFRSYGVIDLRDGEVVSHEVVLLDNVG
jgi:putative phosphoesterase